MARQQQERLTPKQQALRDLEEARSSLAHHATLAAEEWSPRAVISRSLENHRMLWISGAAVAGLALLKILWPSNVSNNKRDNFFTGAKNRGLLALLIGPLAAFARKSVLNYGTQLFESYLNHKVSPNTPDSGTV